MKKIKSKMQRLAAFLRRNFNPNVLRLATGAKIGYGTAFKRGDAASPEVFTKVAEVRKIGSLGSSRGLIDVTNLDSPDFMEYILAMKDGVEMTIEANFLPNNATQNSAAGMIADHTNGTVRNFLIVLPGSFGSFSFSGLVREWKTDVDTNAAMVATFTVKITGAISYAA